MPIIKLKKHPKDGYLVLLVGKVWFVVFKDREIFIFKHEIHQVLALGFVNLFPPDK
jgi:hypothetical protein